jgi:hypothetical protein
MVSDIIRPVTLYHRQCRTAPFMVFSVTFIICEGPKLDARGLKVSCLPIGIEYYLSTLVTS